MIISLPGVDEAQVAFGRRLRRVREARGFTPEGLARACGMPLAHLALAERGRERVTSAELHALISALHVSLGFLQTDDADLSRLRPL